MLRSAAAAIHRPRRHYLSPRYLSTAAPSPAHITPPLSAVRNLGIIAHIDAGKTTLTEHVLYLSGMTQRPGRVDDGTTTMDYLEQERQRGITIQSAAITYSWRDYKMNLIDTPGHMDFTVEVERALRVMDGVVVVVDGVHGAQSQTRTVWRQCGRYGLSRVIFVNKMDREGASFQQAVLSVAALAGRAGGGVALPVQFPLFRGQSAFNGNAPYNCPNGLWGIVDLVDMRMYRWVSDERRVESVDYVEAVKHVDPSEAEQVRRARGYLIDAVCDADDAFLDYALDRLGLDQLESGLECHVLKRAIRRLCVANEATPILLGAAFRQFGVEPLMDAVVDYLPSPDDRPAPNAVLTSGEAFELKNIKGKSASDTALAFKVIHDPQRGPLTFCRVYAGEVRDRQALLNTTTHHKERIQKVYEMYANDLEEVGKLSAGHIGVLSGLKETRTGDTLIDAGSRKHWRLDGIPLPQPVCMCTVEPETSADERQLNQALVHVLKEDPSLRVHEDESGLVLSGMGELHLEVAVEKLRSTYNVRCRPSDVWIAYRETYVGDERAVVHSLDRDVFGRRQQAALTVKLAPIDSDHEEVTSSEGNDIHVNMHSITHVGERRCSLAEHEIQKSIFDGVQAGLMRGPLAGFPVTRVRVHCDGIQLSGWSSESALRLAASEAIIIAMDVDKRLASEELLKRSHCTLLQPSMEVDLEVPQSFMGTVLQDLSGHRGAHILATGEQASREMSDRERQSFEKLSKAFGDGATSAPRRDDGGVIKEIRAQVPFASMLGYSSRLRSMTKGDGHFSMRLSGYEPMSRENALKVMKQLRGH